MSDRDRPFFSLSGLAIVLSMAILMQYLEYRGIFANAEGFALNVYQRGSWYDSGETKIITIGINRRELEDFFGGESPLETDAVRSLAAAIQLRKPAVVGVDLITDTNTNSYANADPQRPWPKEKPDAPEEPRSRIVWAAGSYDARVEFARFIPRLVSWSHDHVVATPREVLDRDPAKLGFDWGLTVYPTDEDGVVRRLPRQWFVDEKHSFENTFARQVARAYCRAAKGEDCEAHETAHEVFLPFDRQGLDEHHNSVSKLFACTNAQSNVCREWRFVGTGSDGKPPDWTKTIVLLGGDHPDMNDWHRTPINERTPGLFINASAVRAELAGPRLERFSHLASLILDLGFGALIVLIFTAMANFRLWTRIAACCVLAPLAVGVGYLLYLPPMEMLWVSWVGMLLTGLSIHILAEVMHHDSDAHASGDAAAHRAVKVETPALTEGANESTPSTTPPDPTS